MIKKNMQGQSQIITTVLIILLVLVGIIIVWNVINRTVKEKSTEVDISGIITNLKLESAYISEDNQTLKITIKRDATGGELEFIKFILQDSEGKTYTTNAISPVPNVLESISYDLKESGINESIPEKDFSDIVKVSIALGYKNQAGEKIVSNIKDNTKTNYNFRDVKNNKTINEKGIYDETSECMPKQGECGEDGCGENLGDCEEGWSCENNYCVLKGIVNGAYIGSSDCRINEEGFTIEDKVTLDISVESLVGKFISYNNSVGCYNITLNISNFEICSHPKTSDSGNSVNVGDEFKIYNTKEYCLARGF